MRIVRMVERTMGLFLRTKGVRSRWISTPWGRLHAFEAPGAGDLPPVVLLHGIAATGLGYAGILATLRAAVRKVVILELPGHGRSPDPHGGISSAAFVDQVGAALDTIPEGPIFLVGNSLGGGVALRYAATRPKRVRGLVLLSPAVAPMSQGEFDELKSAFTLRTPEDGMRLMRRVYPRLPRFSPLFARALVQSSKTPAVRALLDGISPADFTTPEELAKLSMPVLLLWGQGDRLLPHGGLAFLRRHLPKHAQIEEPEGTGHAPQVDDPRATAERIVLFARGCMGPAAPVARSA